MRLKTLEIKGFKSFADKTVLHFDKGVTGVIGPNGCGKSNIIDSIRWAIGEHKVSALRSEKMAGLIFNGSKSRASSGLAEVSLTFENTKNILPTEFTTVTVNRRYFKNGDSEFRLNDVACRLKDINNLFMDTGISTDSYAIIELGMVDEIIKDKENGRRRMLEQAAGISIYKTRKKEAQNKLSATEQDLDRVEDLLFEIQGNMKSLESQARKAERYYKLKKEYKSISIELAKASLEGLQETFKTLNKQQEEQQTAKTQIDAEISKTDAEIEELKLLFAQKEQTLQQLQQAFNQLVEGIREKEGQKNLALQRLSYSKEQKTRIEQFLSDAEERLKDLQKDLETGARNVQKEEEKLGSLAEELGRIRKIKEERQQSFSDKKIKREQAAQSYRKLQKDQFEVEKNAAVAETSIQNLQQAIARLEEENETRKKELHRLSPQLKEEEEELKRRKEELEGFTADQEKAKEDILTTQSAIEKLRVELMEKNRALDAKKNEYDLLKSMMDNLEGYPGSIRFLKKNPAWGKEAPLLSDIISTATEYRAAIESLLEPYLNYYVVDHLEDAVTAVQLLDKNKKGKANFFLLDQFKANSDTAIQAEKGLIAAIDIVETEEKYSHLVQHLLKDVFITDEIAGYQPFVQQHSKAVLIEKSGRQNRSKYRLSGGSVGLFEGNKLGRSKKLKTLQSTINKLQKEVDALDEKIEKERDTLRIFNSQVNERQLSDKRKEMQEIQNKIFSIKNKIENLNSLSDSNAQRLAQRKEELKANHQKVAEDRDKLSSFLSEIKELQTATDLAEKEFEEAEHSFSEINSRFNEINIQHVRQLNQVQTVKQAIKYKESRLEELQAQMTSNQLQLEKTEQTIKETEEEANKTQALLKELAGQREQQQKTLNESDQEYQNIRNDVGALEKQLRQKQQSKTRVDDGLMELKEKMGSLKLQLAGMKERLDVEFKVDLDEILDEDREGEEDVEELKAKVEKAKLRLERMGEINPTAIEGFQEIKKRFDFITVQKEDLVEARESLEATIKEVEDIANQKFQETFDKVKENFIRVFKTLFTEEDEADMFLSDPENLGETKIEIVAKPKGKRPTAITQLSGGEKTLTAIALLFAIYLIKPAPFCILDEVDAPLDDVNIEKFTNMIREFSENSQFIVITHNKQTMAAVDVIYGVTMQEAGVSKLVPVDFRSLN